MQIKITTFQLDLLSRMAKLFCTCRNSNSHHKFIAKLKFFAFKSDIKSPPHIVLSHDCEHNKKPLPKFGSGLNFLNETLIAS